MFMYNNRPYSHFVHSEMFPPRSSLTSQFNNRFDSFVLKVLNKLRREGHTKGYHPLHPAKLTKDMNLLLLSVFNYISNGYDIACIRIAVTEF